MYNIQLHIVHSYVYCTKYIAQCVFSILYCLVSIKIVSSVYDIYHYHEKHEAAKRRVNTMLHNT